MIDHIMTASMFVFILLVAATFGLEWFVIESLRKKRAYLWHLNPRGADTVEVTKRLVRFERLWIALTNADYAALAVLVVSAIIYVIKN